MVGPDQVEADQLLDARGQVGSGRLGVEGLDVAHVELLADHGRGFDHGPAAGAEAVEAGLEQGVDGGGHGAGPPLDRLLGVHRERPAAVGGQ